MAGVQTMKAARFHSYGGLDAVVVEPAPKPEPRDGEVLVRVHAAGVNPFDIYAVEGALKGYFDFPLPVVMGRDASGVIAALGGEAVGFSVGDAVYGHAHHTSDGTFADYAVMRTDRIARKPDALSHAEAASLPNAVCAAWDALFSAVSGLDLQPGQTVLIHGAAGGIGSLAVQLAKWRGARVIGVASTRHEAFLKSLGVDQFVDYTKVRFEDVVGAVDGVVDTAVAEPRPRSYAVMKPGGVYASLRGLPDQDEAKAHAVRAVSVNGLAGQDQFARIAELVEQGAIRPTLAATYPLDEVRAALAQVKAGHLQGKVVLTV
jgi:NADPH:quinone reductase-like Zn-dependent oxidoreductase